MPSGKSIKLFQVVTIKLRILLLLACLSPGLVLADAVKELNRYVKLEYQRLNVPGVAIAIVDHGKLTYLNFGLANSKNTDAITSDTLFEIASISKPITAIAIMRLTQLGLVSLDEPISQYIEPWALPASQYNSDEVTLRRIMSHTAGLSGRSYQGFPLTQELPSLQDSLNGIPLASSKVEVVIKPGTKYLYSGGGFTLTQIAIERATNGSYERYMVNEVFKPLGMINTTVHSAVAPISTRIASPHDFEGNPLEVYRLPELAAGGVKSTSQDLARLALALMGDNPILNSRSISELSAPVVEIDSNRKMALGFEWLDGMLSHGGQNRGWISWMDISPSSQSALIILTNSENGAHLVDDVRCRWDELFKIGRLNRYCEQQAKEKQKTNWIMKLVSLALLALAATTAWRLRTVLSNGSIGLTSNGLRVLAGALCLCVIPGIWFVLLTDFGVYLFAGIRWGLPTIDYLATEVWYVAASLTLFCLLGGFALLLKKETV